MSNAKDVLRDTLKEILDAGQDKDGLGAPEFNNAFSHVKLFAQLLVEIRTLNGTMQRVENELKVQNRPKPYTGVR